MQRDMFAAVTEAVAAGDTINVSRIAERVRLANLANNVAREDIERALLRYAQALNAIVEFENTAIFDPVELEEEYDFPAAPHSLPTDFSGRR